MPAAPFHLLHQPDALVYPPQSQLTNLCGFWGALAADALFTWFGVGAYYAVFSLAVLDYQLLRRRTIDLPALRMTGWIASLAARMPNLQAQLFRLMSKDIASSSLLRPPMPCPSGCRAKVRAPGSGKFCTMLRSSRASSA